MSTKAKKPTGPLAGAAAGQMRRHRDRNQHKLVGAGKGPIRRMARRAGVLRCGHPTNYTLVEQFLRGMLTTVVHDASRLATVSGRKTITSADAHYALAQKGLKVYGDGSKTHKKHKKKRDDDDDDAAAAEPPASQVVGDDDD